MDRNGRTNKETECSRLGNDCEVDGGSREDDMEQVTGKRHSIKERKASDGQRYSATAGF